MKCQLLFLLIKVFVKLLLSTHDRRTPKVSTFSPHTWKFKSCNVTQELVKLNQIFIMLPHFSANIRFVFRFDRSWCHALVKDI